MVPKLNLELSTGFANSKDLIYLLLNLVRIFL